MLHHSHYFCEKYHYHKTRAAYYMKMAEKHKCDKKKYRYYVEKYYAHKHKADCYKMGCKHPYYFQNSYDTSLYDSLHDYDKYHKYPKHHKDKKYHKHDLYDSCYDTYPYDFTRYPSSTGATD